LIIKEIHKNKGEDKNEENTEKVFFDYHGACSNAVF
jgi:hypothetical protein